MGSSAEHLRVLIMAMEFAPVNTTGQYRSAKFVKYLPQFGVEPIVVTPDIESRAKGFKAQIEYGLLDDIPKEVPIYRIEEESGEKYYKNRLNSFLTIYFSIKDTIAKRWAPNLLREIGRIIKQHKPQVIQTSLPPFSSGLLALEIAKKYKLPLVLDMRDAWSHWGNTPFGSYLHYWKTKREEARIFKGAAAILGVTPQLVDIFRASHPDINPEKFHFLPNGFDLDLTSTSYTAPSTPQSFTIGYVGSFYYTPEARAQTLSPWWKKRGHRMLQYNPTREDWLYRSPYFFFRTLAALFEKRPELKKVVRVEFVGRNPEWLQNMVKEFGLEQVFHSHGFVPQKKAFEIQSTFDAFLATSEKVIGGEHYCLPSKTFDYIRQAKPILGFVTKGIQQSFLKQSGLSFICDPDNLSQSVDMLERGISGGYTLTRNMDYLKDFHRKNITQRLVRILRQVTNPSQAVAEPDPTITYS